MKTAQPRAFTVTAHTGAMGTPENSLESMRVGFENADIVEFDVRFNADKIPVLCHGWPIPKDAVTLEEAFRLLAQYPDKRANVDLKSTDNMPAVQELAERTGVLGQIFFTGVGASFVSAVQKGAPKIAYYLNCDINPFLKHSAAYARRLAKRVEDSGAVGLNCNFRNMTPRIAAAMRERGLQVSLWTASNEEQLKMILRLGPDNVTTRIPDKVEAARRQL